MEQWREIPGYEHLYEASDLGNIRTCDGKTTSSARFARRVWKQRVLKPKYAWRKGRNKKDARVSLWKDGTEKTWLVSRLVSLTWCPGYFEGATVNHKDGNPLNNKADNLEWISIAENIQHGFRTGLFPQITCVLIDEHDKRHAFRSLSAASCFLGHNNGYLSGRIKKGRTTATADNGAKYIIQGG